jgi:hypothetical protein
MVHLRVIAREPHPVGSPEDARVRDYLLREISAMGLHPEVQKATVFRSDSGEATAVKNVLVRIDGTEPGRAVLITAHYDSLVTGLGAGDDGMGVAAMLETLRALQAGPPPRNDLIFLFNDGEEPGMLGSERGLPRATSLGQRGRRGLRLRSGRGDRRRHALVDRPRRRLARAGDLAALAIVPLLMSVPIGTPRAPSLVAGRDPRGERVRPR